MRRLLMTTALVLTTATAGFAQENSQIRAQVEDKLMALNINVDVSSLSDEQLNEIFLLSTGDEMGDRSRIQAAIGDMAGPMATMEVSNSQLRGSVQNSLTALGIEGDVSTLSDADVTRLYFLVNSAEMGRATESRIQEVFATMQPGSTDAETETMLVIEMPEGQLRNSVGNRLQTMGIEVDVNALSQEQLAQLHLLTSNPSDENVRAEVEAIVN